MGLPLHLEEDCLVDPEYSEFDCIDDDPPEVDRSQPSQVKGKDSSFPRDLLELIDHYPGKKLCWASELLEDEGKTKE